MEKKILKQNKLYKYFLKNLRKVIQGERAKFILLLSKMKPAFLDFLQVDANKFTWFVLSMFYVWSAYVLFRNVLNSQW